MSNFRPFYSTLNALEQENCTRRANINDSLKQLYTNNKKFPATSSSSYIQENPENILRKSRKETQKVQQQNAESRKRINDELIKSVQKFNQMEKKQLIRLQNEVLFTQSRYRQNLKNSRRIENLKVFPQL